MYSGNKFRNFMLYALSLASIAGCKETIKPPSVFNPKNESLLESRLESYPDSHSKSIEARQDIEKILNLDIIKEVYPNRGSELTCDYIRPVIDSENLYRFIYGDGYKLIIEYYCKWNNNRFDRYAKEIVVKIEGDPYWRITFFNSKSKLVNPDGEMEVSISKIRTEVEKPKRDMNPIRPRVTPKQRGMLV